MYCNKSAATVIYSFILVFYVKSSPSSSSAPSTTSTNTITWRSWPLVTVNSVARPRLSEADKAPGRRYCRCKFRSLIDTYAHSLYFFLIFSCSFIRSIWPYSFFAFFVDTFFTVWEYQRSRANHSAAPTPKSSYIAVSPSSPCRNVTKAGFWQPKPVMDCLYCFAIPDCYVSTVCISENRNLPFRWYLHSERPQTSSLCADGGASSFGQDKLF